VSEAPPCGATRRICYFTNVYPAPSHTTMRREILALSALGVSVVRVAARRFAGPLVEPADIEEAGRTVYTTRSVGFAALCLVRAAWARPRSFLQALFSALSVGRASRRGVWTYLMYLGEASVLLDRARGCSHIHANFGNAIGIATLCRQLGGPPVSLRIHGPEEFETLTAREWNWTLAQASFVSPISEHGVRLLEATVEPAHRGKLRLLRCGVDTSAMLAPADDLPARPHLVCVARLEDRKGHTVLLRAVERLRAGDLPVTLTLVGDGRLRRGLEDEVVARGLRGSVRFTGWRHGAGVTEALSEARVAVLPSFAEGLPIVLMEAYVRGRPVVATCVDGIPELVLPGESGWLVEPGDVDSLCRALAEALAASDELLLAMVDKGRERVRRHHDVQVLMRALLEHVDSA
jgi:colanic acid/amylovoran biosynthesis glycosyltransferase